MMMYFSTDLDVVRDADDAAERLVVHGDLVLRHVQLYAVPGAGRLPGPSHRHRRPVLVLGLLAGPRQHQLKGRRERERERERGGARGEGW